MKKLMIALVALMSMTMTANAMSYEQAREQALFLTDKMAYELNLTDDQYEAAYEINLDYLMSINSYDDLYGVYWNRRNMDLSYILLDWQYRAYCAASYFYRPLYWDAGFWHFSIYARYPHRSYFYFGRPGFYVTYRGGHSWGRNGGRSWYRGRDWGMVHRREPGGRGIGMRNRFDRGDFRDARPGISRNNSRGMAPSNRSVAPNGNRNVRPNDRGINRNNNVNRGTAPNRSFDNRSNGSINRGSTFGGSRSNSNIGRGGTRESSTRSTAMPSRNNFSGSNGNSTPSRSFTPSRSAGSNMGSSSRSSGSNRSFSAPTRSSSPSISGSTRSSGSSRGGSGSVGGSISRGGGGSSSHNSNSGSHGNFGGRR